MLTSDSHTQIHLTDSWNNDVIRVKITICIAVGEALVRFFASILAYNSSIIFDGPIPINRPEIMTIKFRFQFVY